MRQIPDDPIVREIERTGWPWWMQGGSGYYDDELEDDDDVYYGNETADF